MQSLIEKIKNGRLWDFHGGVHPPQRKALSNSTEIEKSAIAKMLYVPVKQHIGIEGKIIVAEGDTVLKGQPLTRSSAPYAVPVHAPTSGTVKEIVPHISAHPSAMEELTICIESDGTDQWTELTPLNDYQSHAKTEVIEALCNAGISGLGGAGFPTHIKVNTNKNVEFLVINGVECEPYITADDTLMREHAWQIRQGIDVLNHLLTPNEVLIAIEDNKPEAIKALQVACQDNDHYHIVIVPTKYPTGGEKQLIQILTGKEVPKGKLPIDIGIVMQNVGTCYAIADAIFKGIPLIQRVVTVTGQAVSTPRNLWVLLGTPVEHLLQHCNYQAHLQTQKRIIMGGPMMGFNLATTQTPVVKITNCILAPTDIELPIPGKERACIRCSACADACPVELLPQQLYWYSKAKEFDKAAEYNLADCIECGACAYVCPSEIPLVHYYRTAKADIKRIDKEKQEADNARSRFEARNQRLERDKQEREEKHRLAAEARKKAMDAKGNDAKSKIAAAVARAKAKKLGAEDSPGDVIAEDKVLTSAPIDENKQRVAAAIARAKAKKNAIAEPKEEPEQKQDSSENQEVTTEENSDKQKVAAAIARAKAKREQAKTQQSSADDVKETDNKQDRVSLAIAKAKARKLARENKDEDNQ